MINQSIVEKLMRYESRTVQVFEEEFNQDRWQALEPVSRMLIDANQDSCLFVGMPSGYFASFDSSFRRIRRIQFGEEVLYERP